MNRIREIREGLGVSRAELAKRIGCHLSQIGHLESGDRRLTVEWIGRVADALGVAPQDIINSPSLMVGDDEVEPVSLVELGAVAEALAVKGLHVYRVLKDSVSGLGIMVGDEITIEQTAEALDRVRSGDVLLCSLRRVKATESALVLRAYIEGDLFTTHRQTNNVAVRRDDPSIRIDPRGAVVRRR